MITLTIEERLFSALGCFYFGVLSVATLVGAVLLAVVLYQRKKQDKKGEKNAYRNY